MQVSKIGNLLNNTKCSNRSETQRFNGFNGFNRFDGKMPQAKLLSTPNKDTISFGNNSEMLFKKGAQKLLNETFLGMNFENSGEKLISNKFVTCKDAQVLGEFFDYMKLNQAYITTSTKDLPNFITNAEEYQFMDRLCYLGCEPKFRFENVEGTPRPVYPVSFLLSSIEPEINKEMMSKPILKNLEKLFGEADVLIVKFCDKTFALRQTKAPNNKLQSISIKAVDDATNLQRS